jgi:hypothetical protein
LLACIAIVLIDYVAGSMRIGAGIFNELKAPAVIASRALELLKHQMGNVNGFLGRQKFEVQPPSPSLKTKAFLGRQKPTSTTKPCLHPKNNQLQLTGVFLISSNLTLIDFECFALSNRKMRLMPGQERSSFSISTFPTKPEAPVIKTSRLL